METIRFTVPGQPVPCLRLTQGQIKWTKVPRHALVYRDPKIVRMVERIRRYWAFKDSVRWASNGKNIDRAPKIKTHLWVKIWFKTARHGDPDNILKAIQDAIFEKDKMVAGMIDFEYTIGEPRCEIIIQQGGFDGKTT